MDDVESNFTQALTNNKSAISLESAYGKSKMSKKDLAQFMKEKLAQTKVASQATTLKSATEPQKSHFVKPPKPQT